VAHERLPADEREMYGPMLTHQIEDALDQLLSAKVAELTKCDGSAKMLIFVRIASGTVQRTFPRNLDGEHRRPAL